MSRHVPPGLAHYIRDLAGFWRTDPRSDGELLAAFADTGDPGAFAVLVSRHGASVWATCRRVLGNDADAEDAFQAAFIALARDAHRVRESPGGWLRTATHHVVLNVRKAARRREAAHRRLCERATTRTADPPPDEELRAVVQEELAGLPERLRVPLALYYLDGKTQAEVGRLLGITDRAVAGRLRNGLTILRDRLSRRGMVVTTTALAVLLGGTPAAVAVPAGLFAAATEAALHAAAGERVAGRAAELALGVGRAAGSARLKLYGLLIVAAAGATVGGAVYLQPGRAASLAVPLAVAAPVPNTAPRADRFGDPLPDGAVARIGTLRFWPERGATDAARSADGTTLVTADGKGSVEFWTADGQVRERVTGPDKARWVSLSPDARRLAAAGAAEVWVWDLEPGGPRLRWTWAADTAGLPRREIVSLAFCPDGRAVVCGDGWAGNTQLLDADTGKSLRTLGGVASPPLCFSADGKALAATLPEPADIRRTRAAVWDIASGRRKALDYPGGNAITDLDLSPDGTRLAWAGRDGVVRTCDPATGREVAKWRADSPAPLLVFLPGGRSLAEFSVGRVLYRNPDTGAELGRPCAAPNLWLGFATSARGAKRVSAGGKHLTLAGAGVVATFEVATGREVGPAGRLYAPPRSLAFSSDGRRLMSLSGLGEVQTWDADTGRPEGRLTFDGSAAVAHITGFGSDGRALVSHLHPSDVRGQSALDIRRWDGRTPVAGSEVATFFPRGSFAASPDGNRVARADEAGGAEIVLSDPAGKELRRVKPSLAGSVTGLAFSADGRTLLTYSSRAGAAEVWDAETGQPRRPRALALPGCAATPTLSADGRQLAVVTREQVEVIPDMPGPRPGTHRYYQVSLWEASTGKVGLRLPGSDEPPGGLAFSPDGRRLAVGHHDGSVAVWDLAAGREARRLTGHRAAVRVLAFSPDGRRLASGSADFTALVWDVTGPGRTAP